ncbi:unnamed protein product [marine sediment metagenome]|uniref:Uncharacterized protein n=1 Tax=marine sediment metagenome TaxID=412755 RepID=X1S8D2_9ZZZZ
MAHTPKGDPKSKGKRYSVTLRGVYTEYLEALVEQGVYHESQDAIRAGLRLLFEHHDIKLYVKNTETSP